MLRRPLPWGVVVSLGLLVGLALGGSIGYLLVKELEEDEPVVTTIATTKTNTIKTTKSTTTSTTLIPQPQTPTTTTTPADVESTTCLKRSMGYDSFVCVCNERQCHYLPPLEVAPSGNARVYISSREALRLDRDEVAFSPPDYQTKAQTLTVNRAEKYQTVHGFGGAFTDATGYNIQSLPQPTQDLLLRSYYSEDGLEYNLGRVPIGGTDFSDREYTYDDSPTEDVKLTSFSLQPDDYSYKINYILRAKSMMPPSSGELLLFSSIWSPPKWMKTSGKYSGFGFLKKEHYQTYADYLVRFLEAYEANNVTFYSVSTGNEPLNGVIPFKNFNSLGWWPQNMHIWIRDHFGPTIRKSKFKDIKILAFDDQRIMLPWMLERVLADKTTTDFIDLIGYHWYLNFLTPGSILDAVHKNWPDKPIINTEACNGDKPWDFIRVMPGDWSRGEYYIQDIINVMHHWTSGWIDWNLALNMQGGPTWAKNWVDSPIIVDSSRGEFYLNPTFYALAHFSKFVPRGSVRVGLSSEGGPLLGGKVAHIAFQRPDNGTTIVMLNKSDKSRDIVIRELLGDLKITMPAKSFATVVYW